MSSPDFFLRGLRLTPSPNLPLVNQLTHDGGYFLNGDVWRMDTDAEELPREPFIPASNTIYYALGVDPRRGDIYVGDAIDYQQQGVVYRFSADGRGLDTLRVGIIPTDFCFR